MAMTRIWNITNDPSTNVAPQNLMVLGKLLRPGQSMEVDESALRTAHKVTKEVKAKLLAVGKGSPSYLAKSSKVELPKGMARAHGSLKDVLSAAPAKVEEVLEEKTWRKKGK